LGAGGGEVMEEERRWEVAEERGWGTEVKVERGVGDRNIARGFGWGPWGSGLL